MEGEYDNKEGAYKKDAIVRRKIIKGRKTNLQNVIHMSKSMLKKDTKLATMTWTPVITSSVLKCKSN